MNVRERVRPGKEGFIDDESPDQERRPKAQPEPASLAPPEPEPIQEEWPIVVKLLHKDIRGHKGDPIKQLSFREPTGGDINRYGNPVHVDQYGDVIINERKMTTMMAALSGVLQPFIEGMDPRDWNSCAYRLRGFFLPDPAAW